MSTDEKKEETCKTCGKSCRCVKTTGKILVSLLLFVVIAVLTLPLWLGPTVRGVANSIVPGKANAAFHLGEFAFNQYNGSFHVGDMQMGNTDRFSEPHSVTLGNFSVKYAPASVFSDTVRIEDVVVDDVFVYLGKDDGYNNFDYIVANFQNLTPKEAEEKAKAEEEAKKKEPKEKDEGGKKVVIDRLVLKGVKVKIGKMPAIPVPTIELKDIGKESESGASLADVWDKCVDAVLKASSAIGEGLSSIGVGVAKLGVEGAKMAAEGAKAAAGAAVDAAKGATEAVKNVTGTAGDAAKNAAGAATDAAKNAAGAAADAAKGAANAVKGLFGGSKAGKK